MADIIDRIIDDVENLDPWKENGYENREHYLKCMADEYGLSYHSVVTFADLLGPVEDFDGLVSALEDAERFDI